MPYVPVGIKESKKKKKKKKVELLQLIKRQLEITDINLRMVPNGTDLKLKFKMFNMDVDFIRYEVILQVKLSYFSLLKDNQK